MKIEVIQTGVLGVNTCIIPLSGNSVIVVDPADYHQDNGNQILTYLKNNMLVCGGIFLTHGHFDHITGLLPLHSQFPQAKIYIHKADAGELGGLGNMNRSILSDFGMPDLEKLVAKQPSADVLLSGGEDLYGWKVIHTPGHSPGCCCYYNEKEKILISGDTLFYHSWGRTDMYGGNEAELQGSLEKLRKIVSPDAKVFPGHGDFGFLMKD